MSASTALRTWAEKNHISSESFFVQLVSLGGNMSLFFAIHIIHFLICALLYSEG